MRAKKPSPETLTATGKLKRALVPTPFVVPRVDPAIVIPDAVERISRRMSWLLESAMTAKDPSPEILTP
jgi:hypothetical protein